MVQVTFLTKFSQHFESMPSRLKKAKQQLNVFENFAFNGISACLSKTFAAPMESAKLLYQLSPTMSETDDIPIYLANPSRFALLFLYQLFKDKGVSFLFSGNGYNCLRYFPTQILNLLFKKRIKSVFKLRRNDGFIKRLAKNVCAGGVAGVLSLAFVYPLDAYRTLYGIDINGDYKSGRKRLSWSQLYSGLKQSLETSRK